MQQQKPSQLHSDKHQSTINYWRIHKVRDCQIPSIKQIFQNYKEWCEEQNVPIQNEYRFRNFIQKRENGYNNGGFKNEITQQQ